MFLNYANSEHDRPSGYMNKSVSLEINSCGTYQLKQKKDLVTCRPKGRIDYQLIYIASGKGYFYFNDSIRPTVVDSGNVILYRPNEFQKYVYFGRDHTHIYWIHFTGSGIDGLFSEYGLDLSRNIISSGTESSYPLAFEQIILELQLRKEFYEESAALLFSQIIMYIGRHNRELSHSRIVPLREMEDVIVYFHEHYQEPIHMEKFIEGRGYSVSSFIRKFKRYTGMTPLQYLLHIRLTYATKLLETTNYPVSEIAVLVGYDNALYFSRLFHKHIGVSPKEYRRNQTLPR